MSDRWLSQSIATVPFSKLSSFCSGFADGSSVWRGIPFVLNSSSLEIVVLSKEVRGSMLNDFFSVVEGRISFCSKTYLETNWKDVKFWSFWSVMWQYEYIMNCTMYSVRVLLDYIRIQSTRTEVKVGFSTGFTNAKKNTRKIAQITDK